MKLQQVIEKIPLFTINIFLRFRFYICRSKAPPSAFLNPVFLYFGPHTTRRVQAIINAHPEGPSTKFGNEKFGFEQNFSKISS